MKRLPVLLLLSASAAAIGQNPIFFQTSFNNAPLAATPTYSPISGGTYGPGTMVTISDSTTGSTITYCTSTYPTLCTPGTNYTSPVAFTSTNTNVCAWATATNYNQTATSCWHATYNSHGVSVVQEVPCVQASGASASVTCAVSAISSGNAVLFGCTSTASSISTTPSSADLIASGDPSFFGFNTFLKAAANVTGNPTTVTITTGAYKYVACVVAEVHGLPTALTADGTSALAKSAFGVGNSSAWTGSVTTTYPYDALFGIGVTSTAETFSAGTGYTLIGQANISSEYVSLEFTSVSSAGNYNPGLTYSNSGYSTVGTVAEEEQ